VLRGSTSGEGFVKVTGEVGTGKTLLSRRLLASLPDDVVTAYLLNPRLTPCGLLRAISEELGLARRRGLDEHALYQQLEAELMQLATLGKRVVLVHRRSAGDERREPRSAASPVEPRNRQAQADPDRALRQPELDEHLAHPSNRSLVSRIAFSARLHGLHFDDSRSTCGTGWWLPAGAGRRCSASAHACCCGMRAEHSAAPNILAHKGLMLAFGRGRHSCRLALAWPPCHDEISVRSSWGGAASLARSEA